MAKAAKNTQPENFLQELMGAFPVEFPVDTAAFDEAFKSSAELNDKLASVALAAAEQSADISNEWTRETLGALGSVSKAKAQPADYAKEMTDFATAQASVATDKLTAFSEVAKTVQTETLEVFLTAAKAFGQDATAIMSKAAEETAKAAAKATAAAK